MKRFLVPLAGFLLCAVTVTAQTRGQSQPQPSAAQQNTLSQASIPTVRSTAQEVVLDMVFRDKKGRAIHDIRPEEIHVLEDGVEQKVTSFHLFEGKAAELSGAPKTPAGAGSLFLDPMQEVRLVTLAFEGLDQDGKRFFRQALKDILDMAPEQNLYFSILMVDQG